MSGAADAGSADRATRNAAVTLALVIPSDTLLYLLLPLHASAFGVSLPEAGLLLAANRLVRIVLYPQVARFYAARGARTAGLVGAAAGIIASLTYATSCGLWLLLAGRVLWGLSFATLNIVSQVIPTMVAEGAARRSGRARAVIASGSVVGLLAGAVLAEVHGPRAVFVVTSLVALLAPWFAFRLPSVREAARASGAGGLSWPSPISLWGFCFGFIIDGLFIFGLSLLAKASFTQGAVIAAGSVMALRYGAQMLLSGAGGRLAERVGALRLLIGLSLVQAVALGLLATSGVLLWVGVLATVLIWALIQPLPPPVLAEIHPGPERVPALARQNIFRDLGAGTGPLAAGLLFPALSVAMIWIGAAAALGAASLLLRRETRRR